MVQKENPKIQTFTEEELVNLLMTAPSKKEIVLRSAMMYMRWGDTVKSPYSKDSRVYQRHCRPLEYRCSKTGNNFTATTHTVFEYSKLTYQKMFRALREYYNDEEITSTKMASALKVTQVTGWRILYRMRYVSQQLGLHASDWSIAEFATMFLSFDFSNDIIVPEEHFLRKGKRAKKAKEEIEKEVTQSSNSNSLIRTRAEFKNDCNNMRLDEITMGLIKILNERKELPIEFVKEYNEILSYKEINKI